MFVYVRIIIIISAVHANVGTRTGIDFYSRFSSTQLFRKPLARARPKEKSRSTFGPDSRGFADFRTRRRRCILYAVHMVADKISTKHSNISHVHLPFLNFGSPKTKTICLTDSGISLTFFFKGGCRNVSPLLPNCVCKGVTNEFRNRLNKFKQINMLYMHLRKETIHFWHLHSLGSWVNVSTAPLKEKSLKPEKECQTNFEISQTNSNKYQTTGI